MNGSAYGELLLIGACFATGVLLVWGIYLYLGDVALRRQRRTGRGAEAGRAPRPDLDYALAAGSLPFEQTESLGWNERFQLWIDQSGTELQPVAFILLTALLGVIPAGLVLWLLPELWWMSGVAYLLAALIPYTVVAIQRFRRCHKLREQLPDALDMMSRMLRAGQTISQALRGVADEFDAPIADEFRFCYEQQNLGLTTDASMYEMARRTGVVELRILVVAVTVHLHTGGNLSELLDNLASVMRDRFRIQGQIRALTADGRLQAAILLGLPPFLLLVLSVLNREYTDILFQYPWLLVGMFGFELLGALWLHRIVSFDF